MSRMKIKLKETEEIKAFVNAAEKCDFDIDLICDSAIVDGKSILGVLSLGLEKVLTVDCHGKNSDFDRVVQRFKVEE